MDITIIMIFTIYLVSMLVGIILSVIIHELGHLICGHLSGYRFVSFRLHKWLWTKDELGKIKVTKGNPLAGILGQCLMEPCDDEKEFRYWLYNAGGGLLNIITGVFFLIPLFFLYQDYIELCLLLLGLNSIFLGIMNLFPTIAAGIPNDGRNIKEIRKSADAKHGFYVILKANAEMSKGKYLADFSEETFKIRDGANINNYFVFRLAMLRAEQIEEAGMYAQSYQLLTQLPTEKLPAFYSGQLTFSCMFHELVYFGDEMSVQRARARLNVKDKLLMKLLVMKHPVFMPHHAAKVAFLDNDKQKARDLIVEARKCNQTQQNPGSEHSVTLLLDKLEQRLAG